MDYLFDHIHLYHLNAHITLLTQKTVPITLKLSDNSESDINYTMSQNTVTIKGKKDIVDSINYH